MKKEEYNNIATLADTHWWYQGMKNITITILKKYLSLENKIRILDVGCGTGFMFPYLSIFGGVSGIDISDEAIKQCHKRKYFMARQGTAENIPYANETFELITSLDVLYHKDIRDDLKVLKEFNRILKPGGYLMIRVPADHGPLSIHDQVVYTRQRYRKKELEEKIKTSGFKIVKLSHANFFLYPLAYLKRKFESRKDIPVSDIKKTNVTLNYILKNILFFEGKLLKILDLPWGLSLICLARK